MTIVATPEESNERAIGEAADWLANVVLGGCLVVAVLLGFGLWAVLA